MPVEPDSQEAAADQGSTRVQAFRQQVEDTRHQNPTAVAAAAAKTEERLAQEAAPAAKAEEERLAQEIEVEKTAEEKYNDIVDAKGGDQALKDCCVISKKALDKRSSQKSRLSQEHKELLKKVPENIAQRLKEMVEEQEASFDRQDPIFGCMSYEQMMKVASGVKVKFDELLDTICQRMMTTHGVKSVIKTGLKGKDRGQKKVTVDYAGDCSMLSDMVRGTIIIQGTIKDLYSVLAELVAMPELSSSMVGLETVKDRYQKPMPGGYRDISLILRVCGMVCELQLNLEEVVKVKESPAGHGLYENTRLLNDDLLYAAMRGESDKVQKALQGGADANVHDGRFSISALSFGAVTGDMIMVTQLLTKGADPCVVDNFGILPAHRSAQFGFEDVTTKIVKAMLERQPAKHNRSTKAAKCFSEFLGVVVDKGWCDLARDLYAWWCQADATKPVPVLRHWVELGWKTTIQRAASVLHADFFLTELPSEVLHLCFAEAAPGAATMLQLDLSNTGIGDEGAAGVAVALRLIKGFQTLQLDLDFTDFKLSAATNVAPPCPAPPHRTRLRPAPPRSAPSHCVPCCTTLLRVRTPLRTAHRNSACGPSFPQLVPKPSIFVTPNQFVENTSTNKA